MLVKSEEGEEIMVARLSRQGLAQTSLDVMFSMESEVSLLVRGPGTVHLSGIYEPREWAGEEEGLEDLPPSDEDEDFEDLEGQELPVSQSQLAGMQLPPRLHPRKGK